MDMQDTSNGDGSMEDANDHIPVLPLARLTKCPFSLYDLSGSMSLVFMVAKQQRIGIFREGERLI